MYRSSPKPNPRAVGASQKPRFSSFSRCKRRCNSSSAYRSTPALGPLAWIGAGLAVAGILFESIGDWQLVRFRGNRDNAGKVLMTGLWRYTRHPNYFGDACVWWGLYFIAADTGLGAWSLPGPLLITYLLTSWSGVPTVEGNLKRKKPDYAEYVRRTSAFIPLPPQQ